MKRNLVIFILLSGIKVYSQNILDSIHPLFKGELNGVEIRKKYVNYGNPKNLESKVILGIFHSNNLFVQRTSDNKNIPVELLELRSQISKGKYSSPPGYVPLFDSVGVIVTAAGVNHLNASKYEFRVLQNVKEEIIPWQPIKFFCQPWTSFTRDGIEQTENAYLGEFRTTLGNSLTIEVRNRNDTFDIYSISAIWINRFPAVVATFSNREIRTLFNVLKRQWQKDILPVGTYYGDISSPIEDSMIKARKEFGSDENSIIFYLNDKIKSKEIIEYNLITDKNQTGWKANDFDLNLIWLKNLSPGNYKLQLRYSIQRHNVSIYEFTIKAAWYQGTLFKVLVGIAILVLVGFIYLLFRSKEQKRKLEKQQVEKQQVETELRSIHSQFNPHFVFNALNSIQAFITKNDVDGANRYLTEFSTLLRDSLKDSGKEMVSLFMEIKMLTSYLNLEQLRFGFNYSIDVSVGIDKNAIEVPALLLQPLVENAVKHGIASLYDKGNLVINFKGLNQDILVTITDNGPGYNPNEVTKGFGLKLTNDRIKLLNKMLKGQSIEFFMRNSSGGTIVQLLFKNWLS